MDRKLWLWLWLYMTTGANVTQFEQVLARFPDLEEAYHSARAGNTAAFSPLGAGAARKLCASVDEKLVDMRLEWLNKHQVHILPLYSGVYPVLLKEIRHPPPLLHVKGRLEADARLPIAIVGMRKNTPYGEAVARHLASELVQHGATIVSGMALGIDACAAEGALHAGADCPTIAVLGSGVDVIYPSENARLYDAIVERGAVISEFPPGTKPLRENFPMRNRVISGLSRGVVVVEAAKRSGTTITAHHALEQGRDVFAVPGRITDENSMGPNGMIQRGEAKPIFCAADILVEYGMDPGAKPPREKPDVSGLNEAERRIVEALGRGERSADELCEMLSLSAAELNSGLTSLQFSGIIKQLPGRVFGL